MRTSAIYWFVATCLIILAFGCKKKNADSASAEILAYSLENGSITNLYNKERKIVVSIDDQIDRKALRPIFNLSPGAVARVNGIVQKSSGLLDLSSPVIYEVESGEGIKTNWQVSLKSNAEEIGLGGSITSEKHNDPNYEWYVNQDSTGKSASSNGGPACLSMALYWSDPILNFFTQSIVSQTGPAIDLSTMVDFLNKNTIPWKVVSLPDRYLSLKKILDKGYILILCIDMRYINFNFDQAQHTERFYSTVAAGGHFVVLKGYREVGENHFWFEMFDPLNKNNSYSNFGGAKGKNRYFNSISLEDATNRWWDYAIVIGKHYKLMDKFETEVKSADVYNTSGY